MGAGARICAPQTPRRRVITWPSGTFVARVDFCWPDLGLFLELDGQGHKDQPVYDVAAQTSRRLSKPERPKGRDTAPRWRADAGMRSGEPIASASEPSASERSSNNRLDDAVLVEELGEAVDEVELGDV
jgi:hypothetical protein